MNGFANLDGCGKFRDLSPGSLKPRTIHRLIVGRDTAVKQLSRAEAAKQLGDPFATLLLLKGTFPNTAGDILAALDRATKPGDPLRERFFFFVGEATQIPTSERVARDVRFLVTTGRTGFGPEDGPDLMINVFHPESEDAELRPGTAEPAGSTTTGPRSAATGGSLPATRATRSSPTASSRARSRATPVATC